MAGVITLPFTEAGAAWVAETLRHTASDGGRLSAKQACLPLPPARLPPPWAAFLAQAACSEPHTRPTHCTPRAELAGPRHSWACGWHAGQGTSLTHFLLFLLFLTIFTRKADQTLPLPAQPPAGVPDWENRHLTVSQRIGLGGDSDHGVTSYNGWLISDLKSRNQACFSVMSITH